MSYVTMTLTNIGRIIENDKKKTEIDDKRKWVFLYFIFEVDGTSLVIVLFFLN